MRILLVNDDGIEAEGILALARALYGKHDIAICAPDGNRSYTSHYMTNGEIKVTPKEIEGLQGVKAWAISGSPADCVTLAIQLLDEKPDMVLSGINSAENLGVEDIICSGTYNAAACARRMGYPSAALSLARDGEEFYENYSYPAQFSVQVIKLLQQIELPKDITLNINIPGTDAKPAGVKICSVGPSPFVEYYERSGNTILQRWHINESIEMVEGTDSYWNQKGYVTISPVKLPFADKQAISSLEDFVFEL